MIKRLPEPRSITIAYGSQLDLGHRPRRAEKSPRPTEKVGLEAGFGAGTFDSVLRQVAGKILLRCRTDLRDFIPLVSRAFEMKRSEKPRQFVINRVAAARWARRRHFAS